MLPIYTQHTIRHQLASIVDMDTRPPCWLIHTPGKALPRIKIVNALSGDYKNCNIRKAVYLIHNGAILSRQIVYPKCAQFYCIRPNHLKCASRAQYLADRARHRMGYSFVP